MPVPDEPAIATKLIQALRRIEADAEGALLHGGNLHKAVEAIRDAAGSAAADAAKQLGVAPYDTPAKHPS
jgi:sialic acid synthase SpsE